MKGMTYEEKYQLLSPDILTVEAEEAHESIEKVALD